MCNLVTKCKSQNFKFPGSDLLNLDMVRVHKLINDINNLKEQYYVLFDEWKSHPKCYSNTPLYGYVDFKLPERNDVIGVVLKDPIPVQMPFEYDESLIDFHVMRQGHELPSIPPQERKVMFYEEHLYRVVKIKNSRYHVVPLERHNGRVMQWNDELLTEKVKIKVHKNEIDWKRYMSSVWGRLSCEVKGPRKNIYGMRDKEPDEEYEPNSDIFILCSNEDFLDSCSKNGTNTTVNRLKRWWEKSHKREAEQKSSRTRIVAILVDWKSAFIPFLQKQKHAFEDNDLVQFLHQAKEASDAYVHDWIVKRLDSEGKLSLTGNYVFREHECSTSNSLFKTYAYSRASLKVSEIYRIYPKHSDKWVRLRNVKTVRDWGGDIYQTPSLIRKCLGPGCIVRVACGTCTPDRSESLKMQSNPGIYPEENQRGLYMRLLEELKPSEDDEGNRKFIAKILERYMDSSLVYFCIVDLRAVLEVPGKVWLGNEEAISNFEKSGGTYLCSEMGIPPRSPSADEYGPELRLDINIEEYLSDLKEPNDSTAN